MISVIFCGGYGTRMNNGKPGTLKPLIEVAGKAILLHIITIYNKYSIKDFLLLGGYKIDDLRAFVTKINIDGINVKVLDTGDGTPTGGRLKYAENEITTDNFLLTYGDSLTNFNLNKCLDFKSNTNSDFIISYFDKPIEYGVLKLNQESKVLGIYEKTFKTPINAGFYILDKRIFSYIKSVNESFEIDVLPRLIDDHNLKISSFKVDFWHPMDTPDDQIKLENILKSDYKILFK
jgi:glucose-1-phosphate cytidylyltransferase